MEPTGAVRGLRCPVCETIHPLAADQGCPDCGAACTVAYDNAVIDAADRFGEAPSGDNDTASDQRHRPGQWRYDALLPFAAADAVTAGEGDTPLVVADQLADELAVDSVYIKDESRNPTGTVYDRGMSLAATAIAARDEPTDIEPAALATTGNSGQSAAAYLGRLGVRSYAFVPSRSAFSNKAMINVHGGEMQVVGGRYPDAVTAVDEQLAGDYYSLQEFTTPYRQEGPKTLAFELFADLGAVPDTVFIPASTGELVVGVAAGFEMLVDLDVTETTPTLVAVQPTGCAPIAAAVESGVDEPEPWAVPDTIVGELEVPEPAGGPQAVAALDRLDGTAITVDDSEILESAVATASTETVEMGAAGGAAPAGAWAHAAADGFDGDETVVLLNTESGTKTPDILRSHLMGPGG
jgi:threonine synthase